MDAVYHCFPFWKVRSFYIQTKFAAYNVVHFLVVEHKWNFVKARKCCVVDYTVFGNVTEERNLSADVCRNYFVTTGYDDVRMDSDAHKFLNGMLCWFWFEFVWTADVRNKTNVNEKTISAANFESKLTDCFKEWLAFDITCSATNFDDTNIGLSNFSVLLNELFDFVCYVRNNLNCLSAL